MRVLFTVQPSTGHLHPLVPVAQALAHAGHRVAVCSSPAFRGEVEAFGLPFFACGLDWLTHDQATWTAFPPMPAPGPEFGRFVITVFADITTQHMLPDVLRVAHDWRPDLIVREAMEYSGCLAAEHLGLPHASIAGNGYSALDAPDVHYFPGNNRLVAAPLARHRQQLGLPADPDNVMPFRYLVMAFMPPAWDGTDVPRPRHIQFFRHVNAVVPGAALPSWVSALPSRPTVLVSLGTVFNKTPGVLEAIVEGLSQEPVNLIVAIGPDQDPARFGSVPDNVRLEHSVPQALLLERCALLVSHAGFNSVKEALIAGVPLVVVPITADQPYNAQRCAALGVAELIGPDHRTPAAVRAAAQQVLGNTRYRARAAAFREQMLALPGPERLVQVLEQLALERTPSPAGVV